MVGGNPPNNLGNFKENIRIRALFLGVNVGLVCGMWKRRTRGSGKGIRIH
jgi:hypothetical protein